MSETAKLTIVTPSYEKHIQQYKKLVSSAIEHCRDLSQLHFLLIVEDCNVAMFRDLFVALNFEFYTIITTESILESFAIRDTPIAFLQRVGKFTFQTVKKLGGLLRSPTEWSLVLDSESIFLNSFAAHDLLENYASQKYVFYTDTAPRGIRWSENLGHQVNVDVGHVLGKICTTRWYMEYFHWFYETKKVVELVHSRLNAVFWSSLRGETQPLILFENVIYYNFLEQSYAHEYTFLDIKAVLDEFLDPTISRRFTFSELPFSAFGNDYILNMVAPSEVKLLAPLFERFKLPFIRLEPPFFSPAYLEQLRLLPHFVATISSQHVSWMRRKIAVCISGEFRQVHHRTPEQQVRHIVGFLSGVECDIFIHSWECSSEALIVEGLKPRRWMFEPRKDFSSDVARNRITEPNIKAGRDAGSVSMFYGLQKTAELVDEEGGAYDYIVRMRPDFFSERSLKEIMMSITEDGDFLPNAIYIPASFHSKGINDQFAIGPGRQMQIYLRTFSHIDAKAEDLFFNPEAMLLDNLLENKVELALVDMPYALMRHDRFALPDVVGKMHAQNHVWWSRTEQLPYLVDLSAFFADKLRAVVALMTGDVPQIAYLSTTLANGVPAIVRLRSLDFNPARVGVMFLKRRGVPRVAGVRVTQDGLQADAVGTATHDFLFKDGPSWVLSQWRLERGRLVNRRFALAGAGRSRVDLLKGTEVKAAWAVELTGRWLRSQAALLGRVARLVRRRRR